MQHYNKITDWINIESKTNNIAKCHELSDK